MGRGGTVLSPGSRKLLKLKVPKDTHTHKLHNTFLLVLHFLPHQYRWHVQSLYLLGPWNLPDKWSGCLLPLCRGMPTQGMTYFPLALFLASPWLSWIAVCGPDWQRILLWLLCICQLHQPTDKTVTLLEGICSAVSSSNKLQDKLKFGFKMKGENKYNNNKRTNQWEKQFSYGWGRGGTEGRGRDRSGREPQEVGVAVVTLIKGAIHCVCVYGGCAD